jgi:CO/xanthine dehydrogenase Mo-binding subunit
VERVDARAKVTGQTRYAADLQLPGLHYGKIVFSAHPHARVLQIDSSRAQRIAGVKKVITAKDLPVRNAYGYQTPNRFVLVAEGEETRYIADAVALVVAESEEIALRAAEAVDVSYEVLPPLTSPRAAMEPGAPLIHHDAEGNRCCAREFVHGDVEAGFRASDVIVERTYATPRQEQAFLETEAGVAYVDECGVLHVFSCIQDPPQVIEDIHLGLGIPKSRIHVRGTPVGGGFGGKLETSIQVHLSAMALVSGVPVKLVLDREESFALHPKRHPMEIRLKVGATKDGTVCAMEGEVLADAGPYCGRTVEVVGFTTSALAGPYRIKNVRIKGLGIYTNNLDSGAMRGFGAPQAAFARECALEALARAVGMHPLELRSKNFLRPGEKPSNPSLGDSPVSLALLSDKVTQQLGSKSLPAKNSSKRIGRGICFDMTMFDVSAIPVLGKSGVGIVVEVHSDGSATVYAGGIELGQGVTTVLAQMAAQELGIEVDQVRVELADTATCPRAGRTSASRLTYVLGNALLRATAKLRLTLLKRAAEMLKVPAEDLSIANGEIRAKDEQSKLSFARVAKACSDIGDNLREKGWFRHPENRYMYGHSFMGTGVDVEVDLATGEIKILKLVNMLDAGKVINPVLAAGQLYGASVQAIGYSLMEDMSTREGRPQKPSLAEYTVPTALDLPQDFVVGSIETPYPTGPYGAKGIAEFALNCTAPTVLNAIADALGYELTVFPVRPEYILAAVREGKVK